jgi:hypothetical protein
MVVQLPAILRSLHNRHNRDRHRGQRSQLFQRTADLQAKLSCRDHHHGLDRSSRGVNS